jgi:site-specific recombinase XerD
MAKKSDQQDVEIVPYEPGLAMRVPGGPLPALVVESGSAAEIAWDDFFAGTIANYHTRLAYERAVRSFLVWCQETVPDKGLHQIMAGDVGRYLRQLGGGLQKKKQHLAGLRKFFNLMVERHIIVLNPAAVAETERLQVIEGATPIITDKQVRQLLSVVPTDNVVGLRDRAIFGVLLYTAARAGAVGRLDVDDYYHAGDQWMLVFREKRNKMRRIPVSHDLQAWIDDYIAVAGVHDRDLWTDPISREVRRPLFPTAVRKEKRLAEAAMTSHDINRMMKRYLRRAGLPHTLSPHSFRVTTITDLLDQSLPLEDVQDLAGHADPRTTRLYDRSRRKVTRNLVERIRVGR